MLTTSILGRFFGCQLCLAALVLAVACLAPPFAFAQTQGPEFTLQACVKPEHRQRLLGEEGNASRRLLLVGDSHMDRSTTYRIAEAVQKTWLIDDWVSRTSTYKQGAPRNIRTGTYMRLGPAGQSLQSEHRPGEMMFTGRVENDIAILATIGPMPGPTDDVIFTQFLSSAGDALYAISPAPDTNWYDKREVVARPIMYWDGTGADTVRSFRYVAYRGVLPSTSVSFVRSASSEAVYTAPFLRVPGLDSGELNLTVSGDLGEDYTGKHFVTIGSQFALCDENGVPLPGFALDTFAPFGWDTRDHLRTSGPGRHYLDVRAIDYLRATRLRPDERMTVMILLGHSDGGANAIEHEQRMRQVIERWRTLCAAADYNDPHFILVHPWAKTGLNLELQRSHAQSYKRITDEQQDVSFISIAEATSYGFYDGQHGLPNYLDQFALHWNNEAAVEFFGTLMWSLLTQKDSCEACYADCDTSTGKNTLDLFDFLCFQNLFVNADPYACDCDQSTGPGVCDLFDFLCFQSAFVTGCQ